MWPVRYEPVLEIRLKEYDSSVKKSIGNLYFSMEYNNECRHDAFQTQNAFASLKEPQETIVIEIDGGALVYNLILFDLLKPNYFVQVATGVDCPEPTFGVKLLSIFEEDGSEYHDFFNGYQYLAAYPQPVLNYPLWISDDKFIVQANEGEAMIGTYTFQLFVTAFAGEFLFYKEDYPTLITVQVIYKLIEDDIEEDNEEEFQKPYTFVEILNILAISLPVEVKIPKETPIVI